MTTLIVQATPFFPYEPWRVRQLLEEAGRAVVAVNAPPTVRALLQAVRGADPPITIILAARFEMDHLVLVNEQGGPAPLQPADLAALVGPQVDRLILLLYTTEDDFGEDDVKRNLQQNGAVDPIVLLIEHAAAVQEALEEVLLKLLNGQMEVKEPQTGIMAQGTPIFDGFPDPDAPLSGREEAVLAALCEVSGVAIVGLTTAEKRALLTQAAQIQHELDRLSPEEKVVLQRQNIIDHWLAQTREAVDFARRDEVDQATLAQLQAQMKRVAEQLADDTLMGEIGVELAAFLQGAATYLNGNPAPTIPPRFQEDWADILSGKTP